MPRSKQKKPMKSSREQPAANGPPGAPAVPDWKPHLSQYAELRILAFASDKDLEAAIDLLWTDALRTLPHDTPDGKSLVVPVEAVAYFRRAGLRFTEDRVLSMGDLSPEEIRRLRR